MAVQMAVLMVEMRDTLKAVQWDDLKAVLLVARKVAQWAVSWAASKAAMSAAQWVGLLVAYSAGQLAR